MNMNFGFARRNGGRTILRFDDTNPEAEEVEYFAAIEREVTWLGHAFAEKTHSSDHFDKLHALAVQLIEAGGAYVCHQTQEQVKASRLALQEANHAAAKEVPAAGKSPWRDRSVSENLRWFARMKQGRVAEGEAFLRFKGDLSSTNPNQWDLSAYRVKFSRHPAAGSGWCIYPTYDFTHCLIDSSERAGSRHREPPTPIRPNLPSPLHACSILLRAPLAPHRSAPLRTSPLRSALAPVENVTHSLCTLEFETRQAPDGSYYWLLDQLGMYKPQTWEYGRLNITHSVLSKRKLHALVTRGVVRGWDDPRLLTLAGLRRRGFSAETINRFCEQIGVTRADGVLTSYEVLEGVARAELDLCARRLMAVLRPLKVTITNLAAPLTVSVRNHPKDESMGARTLTLTSSLFIDRSDFRLEDHSSYFGLAPGERARARAAPLRGARAGGAARCIASAQLPAAPCAAPCSSTRRRVCSPHHPPVPCAVVSHAPPGAALPCAVPLCAPCRPVTSLLARAGKEVGLKHVGLFVHCHEVLKDSAGEPLELRVTIDLDSASRPKKGQPKGVLQWVPSGDASVRLAEVRLYEHLFTVPNVAAEEDWLNCVNPNSLERVRGALGEPALAECAPGARVQFERIGFFVCDQDSGADGLVFNRILGLKESKDKAAMIKAA